MKLSHGVVLHILSEVAYPDFTFLAASDGAGLYLQIEATGTCNMDRRSSRQEGTVAGRMIRRF